MASHVCFVDYVGCFVLVDNAQFVLVYLQTEEQWTEHVTVATSLVLEELLELLFEVFHLELLAHLVFIGHAIGGD